MACWMRAATTFYFFVFVFGSWEKKKTWCRENDCRLHEICRTPLTLRWVGRVHWQRHTIADMSQGALIHIKSIMYANAFCWQLKFSCGFCNFQSITHTIRFSHSFMRWFFSSLFVFSIFFSSIFVQCGVWTESNKVDDFKTTFNWMRVALS